MTRAQADQRAEVGERPSASGGVVDQPLAGRRGARTQSDM